MLLLDGKEVAQNIKKEMKEYVNAGDFVNNYIAIFLLSNDGASKVYVNMKQKFGNDIGLNTFVFSKDSCNVFDSEFDYLQKIDNLDFGKVEDLFYVIDFLNKDINCIGIMLQMPFATHLEQYKSEIVGSISPFKDIDGEGGILMGLNAIDYIEFMPATPAAVINILEHYNLANFRGKTATVLGQSNLIGKPLAIEIVKREGTVLSFNEFSNQDLLKKYCQNSDYIMSATGVLHLIDEGFIKDDGSQVIIDIGWGKIANKPAGDVNFHKVKDKVKAITPVPGGVGPVTVASLFRNIKIINQQIKKIRKVLY